MLVILHADWAEDDSTYLGASSALSVLITCIAAHNNQLSDVQIAMFAHAVVPVAFIITRSAVL